MRKRRLRMLRGQKPIERVSAPVQAETRDGRPVRRMNITLLPDRAVITEMGPDGVPETRVNPLNEEALQGMDYIYRCQEAGYDLADAYTGIDQAMMKILEYGFIPREEEFYELTPEQCKRQRKKLNHTRERMFMLLPKNPEYQNPSWVGIVTETQLGWFEKAAEVIERFCEHYHKHFDTEREKLAWLTTVLPPVFSAGSKSRRDLLHLVK